MLLESINYLFHSIACPSYIKKIGLLREIIAIEARYQRCHRAWQEHLDKSQKIILQEAKSLKNHDRIIVLGAGSLHDLPLNELSKLFKEVHLVDIFFLQSAINEIKSCPNVDFHQLDITGVLKAASQLNQESISKIDLLSGEKPKDFLQDENIDMVLSLNLLSQLPISIKNYYEREDISSDHLTEFYQSLILNHLGYLRAFALNGSKVLLITDYERELISQAQLINKESSLEDLPESIFNGFTELDQWQWQLAPTGELNPNYALELKVKALMI